MSCQSTGSEGMLRKRGSTREFERPYISTTRSMFVDKAIRTQVVLCLDNQNLLAVGPCLVRTLFSAYFSTPTPGEYLLSGNGGGLKTRRSISSEVLI